MKSMKSMNFMKICVRIQVKIQVKKINLIFFYKSFYFKQINRDNF